MNTTKDKIKYLKDRGVEVISYTGKNITVVALVCCEDENGMPIFSNEEVVIENKMESIRNFIDISCKKGD